MYTQNNRVKKLIIILKAFQVRKQGEGEVQAM